MIRTTADGVVDFLRFLRPSLPECRAPERAYRHLGALLADVSLQSAVNYEYVVLPRVRRILDQFPAAIELKVLRDVVHEIGPAEFLRWKGLAKIGVFTSMLRIVDRQCVSSVDDICSWCGTKEAAQILLEVTGFGRKSLDYLRLLCGIETIPVDRHIMRFLTLAGVDCHRLHYDAMQAILLEACEVVGIEPYRAERGLWILMRSCGRR